MQTLSQPSIRHQRALVTGAGSGIGRALALRLARAGADLCLVGRRKETLQAVGRELAQGGTAIEVIACDLAQNSAVMELAANLVSIGRLDILIHCAGVITLADLATVTPEDLDLHYRVHVRAPLVLTQALLPSLRAARGQIVFVNSSLGVRTKERAGAYAASKHALKAIADTLRMEINASGVRVLSVFPGTTATPMQERISKALGTRYLPGSMLQPDDVAAAVVDALRLPGTAEVTDLHVRPATKPPS
jgi:short-subunit dehydrogenase